MIYALLITAISEACVPATVSGTAGEKVKFVVPDEASGDREIEGTEGTRLEAVFILTRRTRSVNLMAPCEGGSPKVKCYIPGGLRS